MRREKREEIFESIMAENFPVNDKHQTMDPGSSEQDKFI